MRVGKWLRRVRPRIRYGREAVRDIVGKVWPWVLAGIAVGAAIRGYVPENFMTGVVGAGILLVGYLFNALL